MSNILARFRGDSDWQLLTDARKLRGELTNWSNNTDNIPKRKRNIFQPDLLNSLNRLVKYVKAASKYPSNKQMLQKRKKNIAKAINECMEIWDTLQWIYDCERITGGLNLDKLEPHLISLYNITNDLKAWKKAGLPKKK